jgi:hypothetical protein
VASVSAVGVTAAGFAYITLHHLCFSIMPLTLLCAGGALIFDTAEAVETLSIAAPRNLVLSAGGLCIMAAAGTVGTARTGCMLTQGAFCGVLASVIFATLGKSEGLASSDHLAISIFGGAAAALSAAKFFSPILIERYGVGTAEKPKVFFPAA